VQELVDLLRRLNPEGNHTDMPVEMARLFHDKVQHFMKQHVLCQEHGILGDVKHWFIRYEAQVSGELTYTHCYDSHMR